MKDEIEILQGEKKTGVVEIKGGVERTGVEKTY